MFSFTQTCVNRQSIIYLFIPKTFKIVYFFIFTYMMLFFLLNGPYFSSHANTCYNISGFDQLQVFNDIFSTINHDPHTTISN